jgi:effector-binding domain-containing protein
MHFLFCISVEPKPQSMKFLKVLLYIVAAIVALVLIIPLFMPATVQVSAEEQVALTPAQVFHNSASYTDRNLWDPWLETEPEADFTLTSSPDYVGSEYTWSGKKIGSGRMVVDSVIFGKYIASDIYFSNSPEPSLVEWELEASEEGTSITWNFTAETGYPIERLMVGLMKGSMRKSFEKGLDNLKSYLEENPPSLSSLSEISQGSVGPMHTLVMKTSGTMEQFPEQMGEMFPRLAQELEKQGLQMAGMPFTHYLSYDEDSGITEYLCGMPVATKGRDADGVMAKSYKALPVIQAVHTGPYEEFEQSYVQMMEYLEDNELGYTMEAFEFYMTDPMAEPNVTKWQTLIAMPIK